jgi:hypothetical protein
MVWAFEYLTDKQKDELRYLNPFIDFKFSQKAGEYYWTTYCEGHSKEGKEIRKIRLREFADLRQGFLCDDFLEAKELCRYLESPDNSYSLTWMNENYKWIPDYLRGMEISPYKHWLRVIAMPLATFIEYYEHDTEKLQLIDDKYFFNT